MGEMSLDSLKEIVENAHAYLNTQEGFTAMVGVLGALAGAAFRYLAAEFVLPAVKGTVSVALSLVRSKPSLILREVVKSLEDPAAVLNESATGQSYDELMTSTFVVRYDRALPHHAMLKSISTSGKDILDVLTPPEKKAVARKLQSTVAKVKARDVALQREVMLKLLQNDVCKADVSRR